MYLYFVFCFGNANLPNFTLTTYVHFGPFSNQWRSLKHLPFEKLELAFAAWFRQFHANNASVYITNLKEALHVGACLEGC
jgi:hypothetical protein